MTSQRGTAGRPAFCSFVIVSWILVTLSGTLGQQLPNQPLSFAIRGANPFLAYSFRQSQCVTGIVQSDVAPGLPLTLAGGAITSCPVRNGFASAILGVTHNATTAAAPDAVKSAPLNSVFNSISVPGVINKAFSVEIWFSRTQLPIVDDVNVLLELGGATGSGTSPGNGTNDFHFRVTYKKLLNAADDELSIRYSFQRSSDLSISNAAISRDASNAGDPTYDSNLESIGTNVDLSTIYVLVVTIDSVNVNAYIGRVGGSLGQHLGSGNGLQIKNFGFPSTSVIRPGCTRSPGSGGANSLRNFPGTIHFVGFYDVALSAATVTGLLAAGLPNSSPAVQPGDIPLGEDTLAIINMNTTHFVFDFEGNAAARFRIRSRPTFGKLRYNDIVLPPQGDFAVTDVGLLRYSQNTPNGFSIINGTTCASEFDSFTFDVSDLICDRNDTADDDPKCNSVLNSTVRICIVDTQDLPTGVDIQPQDVRSGNNRSIILDPVDLDDRNGTSDNLPSLYRSHEPPFIGGLLSANVAVQFNITADTYGRIEFFNPSGTACNTTQVPVNTWIPASPGARNFQFCYQALASPPQPAPGLDHFYYRFRDRGLGVGPYSKITIRAINPIETCPSLAQVPAPLSKPCESSGDETTDASLERLIPVYITGSDTLNRQLRFVLNTLPSHGKLYVATGVEPNLGKGSAVATGAEYLATPQNVFKMVYVGDVNFFTRFNVSTENFWRYANWEGKGIDGCVGSGTSCRCSSNVDPGCPDSFKYVVRAGAGQSDEGTYNIQVNGRPSPYSVTQPASFAYSRTARFNFVGSSVISIQDPDDDTYNMSGKFNPTPGRLGTSIVGLTGRIFTIDTYDCIENGCGEPLLMWGTPTALNTVLSRLFFTYTGVVVGNETSLNLNVYKAIPDGTTTLNAAGVYNLGSSRVITRSINIFIQNAAAEPGGSANTLDIAIYAGAGAAGFLAVICCLNACVWFVRKSRKAAKAVRKSMASSRRSQSGRQSQQHVMIEEDLEDKRSRSDPGKGGAAAAIIGIFCCMGKDKDDDDDDRAVQHAALAQQRQSVASQHSVRSHASQQHRSQRQSQGMVAYQNQPPAFAEPPTKGREMVAPSVDGTEATVADDSVFAWEKHIDRRTGDVYFFNPRTGVSQWDPPTIKVKRTGK